MQDRQGQYHIRLWPWIFAAVLLALAAIQVVRVNAPKPAEDQTEAFHATEGSVLDGNYIVPAGDLLAVRMDLNHRVKLTGRFRTPARRYLIETLVMDAANFERWKAGAGFERLSQTGAVPGGKISLVMEAGTYYLVLNNRGGSGDTPVEAHFSVD